MGLFKKAVKAALGSSSKSKPKSRASAPSKRPAAGDVDVNVEGLAPPPATGPQYAVKLKAGKQIVLGVNTNNISDEAAKQLLGRRKEDEEDVERSVRGFMFRDLESQYPDSVRVETAKGALVGWVIKRNSYYACEMINQIGQHLAKGNPALAGRAPKLNVSLFVSGSWGEGDEEGTWEPYVDDVEIRLSAPVDIQEFDAN